MHRDTQIVPVEVSEQLSADVLSFTNVDPRRFGLKYVDARLLHGVRKDRCASKGVTGWIPPTHGSALLDWR